MPKLWRKLFRSARKRIRVGLKDFRTWRLYMAGREILAERDYEHLHIAKVAAMAGISVGAFYERFKSKEAFIAFLITERFNGAKSSAEDALHPKRFRGASSAMIVTALVDHSVKTLHGSMGGVVKAAFKRGQIDGAYQYDLKNYRAIVTKHALVLLKPKAGHTLSSDRRIRAAVQMMHAVALDALHHDSGALKRGRKRTAHALSTMMLSYLDLPLGHLEADRTVYGADELIDIPNELGPSVATSADLKFELEKRKTRQR